MSNDFLPAIDALYSSAHARALDAFAVERLGVTGRELMTRAAAAALQALRARWSAARSLVVVCGGGLNGGDGFVLARLAHTQGYRVRVIALVEIAHLTGDAAWAAGEALASGVSVRTVPTDAEALGATLGSADVIVDALLGIGLQRDVEGVFATVIDAIHRAARPVLALDVPSGLCADTGTVRATAVRADLTVTFIVAKFGLFSGEARRHVGQIVRAPLGLDPARLPPLAPIARLLDGRTLRTSLPRRPRDTHKGEGGHVLVVGGGEGMPGAARLAGLGALRAGAGRVTVMAAPSSVASIAAGTAELMVRSLDDGLNHIARPQAIVLGPGLGRDAWGRAAFATVLAWAQRESLPIVLDADALTILAESIGTMPMPVATVLTPHPGEAARLLGLKDAASVQGDRWGMLARLVQRSAAVVALKGEGTLVGAPTGSPALCTRGHPVMAAPGTGDVLAGIVGALLAQGRSAVDAAELGVLWHALAGERLARGRPTGDVDRGRLASELARELPDVLADRGVGETR